MWGGGGQGIKPPDQKNALHNVHTLKIACTSSYDVIFRRNTGRNRKNEAKGGRKEND